ncbi:sensor histidine kinase [uncultured Chitinophaga sp.]|uniref:sensor histidine kinase n=1 Tax=uncultured Chitinophaga sp. TaxID=339340 RepID=UPI0025D3A2B1|nr:histidine kinase [uncultured Chitinophaga sp.]
MATPLSSAKSFRFAFTTTWMASVMIQTAILYYWFGFDLHPSFTDASIQCTLIAAATMLISHNLAYYRPTKGRYFFILTLNATLAVACIYACYWLLGLLFRDSATYFPWLQASLPVRFIIIWIFLSAISMLSIFWYEMEDQKETIARKENAEKLAREAELFKLRHQLQPHFLFNSLNSINALISLRPEEARQMVQKLSDFLRGTLKKEDQSWTTLKEEIQYLQWYLDIEKVRFRHRLSTEIIVSEGCDSLQIPPMLLQPVVENAIKFGLYDTIGEITIRIKAWTADDMLLISVENPFDPELQNSTKGTGFGLSSIQRRLFLLFGRSDLLTTDTQNTIFTTYIKVPQPK